jgi:restriction endonuclease S subunit
LKDIEELYLNYIDGFIRPYITHDQFKNTLILIPVLLEQAILVGNIELLFEKCRNLEIDIKQRKVHSQTLIQAVLSEVFDGEKNNAV